MQWIKTLVLKNLPSSGPIFNNNDILNTVTVLDYRVDEINGNHVEDPSRRKFDLPSNESTS